MICLWSHLMAHGWLWWLAACASLGAGVVVLLGCGYVVGVERFGERWRLANSAGGYPPLARPLPPAPVPPERTTGTT